MKTMDGRRMLAALAAVFGAGALAACGSGGGDTPKPADSANLYVKSISVPNYNGILLDEDIEYVLSAPVNEDSINPDSVQMRTGAQGGTAPFGVFVRGEFYVDPSTGTRVVVDPDKVTPSLINRVERGSAPLGAIPDIRRIDLGFDQPPDSNGGRRLLFNRAKRHIVTFVPEIPTRAALDDTGFTPGATYAVAIPGYPSTNTLENVAGAQLLSPNNRVFTSTFTCVPNTAGNLFLGAESAGPPRVIHSSPFNGEPNIPVTSPINIRFSHALDPRTVTPDKFKVELVSVAPPYPQIGCSVFLAQQRLGKIEVILTPVNPLPPDGAIRVTIDSAIEDLVGQGLNQTSFSFFTGPGGGVVGPFVEEFVDTLNQSAAATTANWNNTKPYVGGAAGQLVAAFAPYAGDGTDGAFAATVGVTQVLSTGTTAQRVYNYTTFSIPIGATVVATGNFPLVVHCQGAADISGDLQLNGSNGGHGARGDSTSGPATGGQGGAGGPGGSRGGNGAFATVGGGGNFDGINGQAGGNGSGGGKGGFTGQNDAFPDSDPFWPRLKADGTDQSCVKTVANGQPQSFSGCRQRECGGGGGYLAPGGEGANKRATELSRDGATIPNGGNGGAAYGDAALATVYSTNLSVQVRDPNTGGLRTIVLNGIPTLGPGSGGSGGGGGGGEDDLNASSAYGTAGGEDEGGGAGGGGGGAFQLVSYTNVNIAGRISCDGGIGGSSVDDATQTTFSQGAGGGGGSGGTIFIQCRSSLSIQPGAILSVAGGVGGQGFADGTIVAYAGGTGSEGRIRIEDSDGNVVNAPAISSVGTFAPTLDLNSTAVLNWQDTGIFDPDFSEPVIVGSHFPQFGINSSIQVFLEGAPENTLTAVSDPDTANSTGFIKVYDTNLGGILPGNPWDTLDQNKWWRFRVDFSVDGFHTFTDPMPSLESLTVVISN